MRLQKCTIYTFISIYRIKIKLGSMPDQIYFTSDQIKQKACEIYNSISNFDEPIVVLLNEGGGHIAEVYYDHCELNNKKPSLEFWIVEHGTEEEE